MAYFADVDKAIYLKRKPKLLAQVQADLPILQGISTKAAYPETAFLPQPDEDKAPAPQGATPTKAAPTKPIPTAKPTGPLVPVPTPKADQAAPDPTTPKPQP